MWPVAAAEAVVDKTPNLGISSAFASCRMIAGTGVRGRL